MGNFHYRPTPRRTHNSEEGHCTSFNYGASQITGWRNKQEDRYICLPKFHESFSLFAVYDGHGGGQVVQYLHRFLHQHILSELILHNDPELALYLGFLTSENSLKNITEKELTVIQDDLDIEFDVPDREERREVISGFRGLISNNSAGASKKDCADNDDTPGTSKGTSKGAKRDKQNDFRAEVVSVCFNELKSVIYLTKAPIEKEDESDEEYEPEKDNIKHDYFETSAEDEETGESVDSSEVGEDENEESAENNGEEDDKIVSMEVDETGENKIAEQSKECEEENNKDIDGIQKNLETANSPVQSKDKDDSLSVPQENKKNLDTDTSSVPNENLNEQNRTNNVAAVNKPDEDQFGATCGSTATVVLLNEKKVYLANVGDSRCVACINGQAVEFSVDHKPTIKDEKDRIINAGGTISEDFRVNGYLDMSRAFGDFEFKEKKVDEPFQMISCEPYISTIDITPDLDFIIIASDGIWNTMDTFQVIDYLKNRLQDTGMALRDICGELFEEILPSKVTDDGSGCDNMTAILIQFKEFTDVSTSPYPGLQECYKYYYPPEHKKRYFLPETDNSASKEDMLPDQGNEKGKPESKEVASSLSTYERHCEQLDPSDESMDETLNDDASGSLSCSPLPTKVVSPSFSEDDYELDPCDSYEVPVTPNPIGSPYLNDSSSDRRSSPHSKVASPPSISDIYEDSNQEEQIEISSPCLNVAISPISEDNFESDPPVEPIQMKSHLDDSVSDINRCSPHSENVASATVSEDHYEQDPLSFHNEFRELYAVFQGLLSYYEDLWCSIQVVRERMQILDEQLSNLILEVDRKVSGLLHHPYLGRFKDHSGVANRFDSTHRHPRCVSSNLASTANLHSSAAFTSRMHQNAACSSNIPTVPATNSTMHANCGLGSVLPTGSVHELSNTGKGSMPEKVSAECESVAQQNRATLISNYGQHAAEDEIIVIDLTSDDENPDK